MGDTEIKGLLEQSREWRDDNFDSPYFLPDMEHAIETLLARVAALEAESLRVVVGGEAKPFDDVDARFIEYNGHIYQWNEVLDHGKSAIPIYGGSPVGIRLNNRDVPVWPVRLERWEADNDHD